ncbi:folate/biopterin family MFS transporter [Nitratireductor sp. XY-223]|uniref:folate/biopterin family MFS transporter n=1 Tax=Nitratireductor sp. XY-223 TaxID=2561926 RepID=UPI0010AB46E0|nr:folate/biopterin family MFS transporter [Nitratireductor sp. XY-223]
MTDVATQDQPFIRRLAQAVFVDLYRQFRWSYLPPLMVYFAAGISGLTAIVGTFFVKEYLGLSAAFLAGLAFWAGIPWALKMPMGHLVDIIWRWKGALIFLGAGLVTASLMIMFALIAYTADMVAIMPISAWYVLSVLLAPSGYVIQDSVADAMSVEAVPRHAPDGRPLDEAETKALHTTMQTLGRIALISGLVFVALLNIFMFAGVENMNQDDKAAVYARIYLTALAIPAISVSGVLLASVMKAHRRRALRRRGRSEEEIAAAVDRPVDKVEPNWWYFIGGGLFVALTLIVGLSDIAFSQEIVFTGSMAIVLVLMHQLIARLDREHARALIGTAIIIFVFRAVPLPGAGATWFSIDVLGFDQQFLSVLSLIASMLTLAGMIVLRPLIATRTITHIVVLLTIAAGILSLPNIGLYYGLHHWTAPLTGGVVDARFIAVIDTAIESPLGQIAMIPMLAWIAKNAPYELKATFFAVMASFTNLALSASSLLTKYLNQIFVVTREVRDLATGEIVTSADYGSLGRLLIVVAVTAVIAPLITIALVQLTVFRTNE